MLIHYFAVVSVLAWPSVRTLKIVHAARKASRLVKDSALMFGEDYVIAVTALKKQLVVLVKTCRTISEEESMLQKVRFNSLFQIS